MKESKLALKVCFFISFFILSACSGPEYHKPQVNVPQHWVNKKNSTNKTVKLAELAWWQQFQDPQLNQFISIGSTQSNQVLAAMANLDYAKAQLKQVKLAWIPGINLTSGYSELPYLGNPGYFFGLFPSYVLNISQQLKMQKSASYQVEANQYAKDGVRLTVIAQISGSYFTLLAQTQALQLSNQLLAEQKKLLSFYQWQYKTGVISQDNLDDLKSEIQKTNAQIIMTKHNIVVSKNALHYLLNQNPGDLTLNTSFSKIKTNAVIPGNLPINVLNNRPDVQQAEALLKVANANVGVATSNLLPSISFDNLFMDTAHNNYVNLNEGLVNIPVLAPTAYGQISVNKAQYKSAYINYVNTIRSALRDIENDFSAYNAYSQKLKDNENAYKEEARTCHLSRIRYQQGIESGTQPNQCAIRLTRFAITLNQDKLEKLMALVALYQDLGGGYRET